jgi:hypothetical protein
MISSPDWIDLYIQESNRRYAARSRQEVLSLPATFIVRFDNSKLVGEYRKTVTVAEGVVYSGFNVHVDTVMIRDHKGRIMREFPSVRDLMDCLRARGKVTLVWNDLEGA